ncbi:hypothetical protein OAG34_01330 [bacterium]|nr:hypothetical protein [bacterium]
MMWNMIAPHVTLVFAIAILSPRILATDQAKPSPVALQLESLGTMPGSDRWDWWQARTAYIPGRKPMWLTTMSETGKGVSHDFLSLSYFLKTAQRSPSLQNTDLLLMHHRKAN